MKKTTPTCITPIEKISNEIHDCMLRINFELARIQSLHLRLAKSYGNKVAAYKAHVTMAKQRVAPCNPRGKGRLEKAAREGSQE